MVAQFPVGGVAWDYLQYAIGLARLGHDVYYHEDTWCWPYHPIERRNTSSGEYSANYIRDSVREYAPELSDRWHYLHLHDTSFGMSRAAFDEVARTADLFLNVSGASEIPDHLAPNSVKVFVDTDPGYNQLVLSERFTWSENVERWCTSVAAHDQHLTYAENIHSPGCRIPKLGIAWRPTRMPIVVDLWERTGARPNQTAPWTTVMTWNGFRGKLYYEGVEYASKGREFEKLLDLPGRVAVPMLVAVGGANAPLDRLKRAGWQVVDGPSATISPHKYQQFIASSRGEVSPAKHIYVAMQSGWFSCRSACYLAVGRPVVVQETGFSEHLPVGEGLLSFRTREEAVAAIRSVESDYERHAKAARAIAEEYFDSGKVLGRLIEEVMQRSSEAVGPRAGAVTVTASGRRRRS